MPMHYVVTGGAGFIGSHLVRRLLAAGHRVSVIDDLSSGKRGNVPPGAHLTVADITTPGAADTLLREADGCFHLAAIVSVQRSQEDWLRTHQVNLGATVALLDTIRRLPEKIPVVFASSAAVYGAAPAPQSEVALCAPLSAYGADKLACEFNARISSELYGVPTIGLRFFNVYGPGQDASSPYSGVISIFTRRMRQHQPVTIYGDGGQTRDFIFVEDVAAALDAAMGKLHSGAVKHGIYNVCTGQAVSVNRLAQEIAQLTASRSAISHGPARTGEVRDSRGDAALSSHMLGVKAATPLHDGLSRTLAE